MVHVGQPGEIPRGQGVRALGLHHLFGELDQGFAEGAATPVSVRAASPPYQDEVLRQSRALLAHT